MTTARHKSAGGRPNYSPSFQLAFNWDNFSKMTELSTCVQLLLMSKCPHSTRVQLWLMSKSPLSTCVQLLVKSKCLLSTRVQLHLRVQLAFNCWTRVEQELKAYFNCWNSTIPTESVELQLKLSWVSTEFQLCIFVWVACVITKLFLGVSSFL